MPDLSVTIGDTSIVSVPEVRNLGAIIDNMLSMKSHIKQVCRGAWCQLRRIGQIRQYLDTDSTKKLINAFVTSRIDNLNSLLYNVPNTNLKGLQKIQYAAARMILLPQDRRCHMSPLLKQLHWLPITYRIQYTILIC